MEASLKAQCSSAETEGEAIAQVCSGLPGALRGVPARRGSGKAPKSLCSEGKAFPISCRTGMQKALHISDGRHKFTLRLIHKHPIFTNDRKLIYWHWSVAHFYEFCFT